MWARAWRCSRSTASSRCRPSELRGPGQRPGTSAVTQHGDHQQSRAPCGGVPVCFRPADPARLPQESGHAARRCDRLLRVALDRAGAHPLGDRALALRRSGGLADPARAVAGLAGPEPGRRSARRRFALSRQPRRHRQRPPDHADGLQFSGLLRHREGAFRDPRAARNRKETPLSRFRAPSCGSRCCA